MTAAFLLSLITFLGLYCAARWWAFGRCLAILDDPSDFPRYLTLGRIQRLPGVDAAFDCPGHVRVWLEPWAPRRTIAQELERRRQVGIVIEITGGLPW